MRSWRVLEKLGGRVECDRRVESLAELPPADAVLLDLTPRQVLAIAGDAVPDRYRKALSRFRYGPGVFKLDWALDGPIPWANADCARAATVHLGGTLDEITDVGVRRAGRPSSRTAVRAARPAEPVRPLGSTRRSPAGTQTAWAYCHVPNGSTVDMTDRIERQIERFAPGFRDRIVARHAMNTAAVEAPRRQLHRWRHQRRRRRPPPVRATPHARAASLATPIDGVYLCSSSTPPGGGVHGMCGWHAAQEVMRHSR